MFTGIIQNISKLEKIDHRSKNYTFILNSNLSFNKNDLGTSISVDGVCLTLVKVLKFKKINKLFFNISPETLKISSLKFKKKGDLFNLEKSLKYGDEIAGHFVQGHVDDVGKVISITKNKNSWCFWFKIRKKFNKFLIKKGSIAINGVSLTINEIKNSAFRADIIPHTFKKTNFSILKKNMIVNVEFDLLIKFLKK